MLACNLVLIWVNKHLTVLVEFWTEDNDQFRCFFFTMGYGLNCVPPKKCVSKSEPPVPQNVTLFGDKDFTEVIKLKWGH